MVEPVSIGIGAMGLYGLLRKPKRQFVTKTIVVHNACDRAIDTMVRYNTVGADAHWHWETWEGHVSPGASYLHDQFRHRIHADKMTIQFREGFDREWLPAQEFVLVPETYLATERAEHRLYVHPEVQLAVENRTYRHIKSHVYYRKWAQDWTGPYQMELTPCDHAAELKTHRDQKIVRAVEFKIIAMATDSPDMCWERTFGLDAPVFTDSAEPLPYTHSFTGETLRID